jgi:hypothetical protein
MDSFEKVGIGGGLLFFVIGLIILPMLLFSKLNPLGEDSYVVSGQLTMSIRQESVDANFFINLFTTDAIAFNNNPIDASYYEGMGYGNSTSVQTKDFDPY